CVACRSSLMAGSIGSTRPIPINEITHANATAKTALGWLNRDVLAACIVLRNCGDGGDRGGETGSVVIGQPGYGRCDVLFVGGTPFGQQAHAVAGNGDQAGTGIQWIIGAYDMPGRFEPLD